MVGAGGLQQTFTFKVRTGFSKVRKGSATDFSTPFHFAHPHLHILLLSTLFHKLLHLKDKSRKTNEGTCPESNRCRFAAIVSDRDNSQYFNLRSLALAR